MADAFEPVGLYDESSVFIDGIYAVKRQKGDYDLVRDQTGETMREVKHSLEMDSSGHVVPRNVVRDEEEYVVLLHKSKKPYPSRQCKIENMCGIFAELLYKEFLKGACVFTSTVFGMNHEMYHTEGNVTVVRNKAFFKGCRGYQGARRLSRAIYLPGADIRVHMAVLTGMLGKTADVSGDGYVERRLLRKGARLTGNAILAQHNCVRFAFDGASGLSEWRGEQEPVSNDWSVSSR